MILLMVGYIIFVIVAYPNKKVCEDKSTFTGFEGFFCDCIYYGKYITGHFYPTLVNVGYILKKA